MNWLNKKQNTIKQQRSPQDRPRTAPLHLLPTPGPPHTASTVAAARPPHPRPRPEVPPSEVQLQQNNLNELNAPRHFYTIPACGRHMHTPQRSQNLQVRGSISAHHGPDITSSGTACRVHLRLKGAPFLSTGPSRSVGGLPEIFTSAPPPSSTQQPYETKPLGPPLFEAWTPNFTSQVLGDLSGGAWGQGGRGLAAGLASHGTCVAVECLWSALVHAQDRFKRGRHAAQPWAG